VASVPSRCSSTWQDRALRGAFVDRGPRFRLHLFDYLARSANEFRNHSTRGRTIPAIGADAHARGSGFMVTQGRGRHTGVWDNDSEQTASTSRKTTRGPLLQMVRIGGCPYRSGAACVCNRSRMALGASCARAGRLPVMAHRRRCDQPQQWSAEWGEAGVARSGLDRQPLTQSGHRRNSTSFDGLTNPSR